MDKIIFYRCFLGWYVLLTKKQTKRRKEYQIRVWRER